MSKRIHWTVKCHNCNINWEMHTNEVVFPYSKCPRCNLNTYQGLSIYAEKPIPCSCNVCKRYWASVIVSYSCPYCGSTSIEGLRSFQRDSNSLQEITAKAIDSEIKKTTTDNENLVDSNNISNASSIFPLAEKSKRKRYRFSFNKWITVSTITFIITLLGTLSITNDALNLASTYIFPTSTAIPTDTPIPPSTPVPQPVGRLHWINGGAVYWLDFSNSREVQEVNSGLRTGTYTADAHWMNGGSYLVFSRVHEWDWRAWQEGRQPSGVQKPHLYLSIFTMNAFTQEVKRLTSGEQWPDYQPVWSPNANKIVFTSEEYGNQDINIMNTDGTDKIRLTNNTSNDFQPVWSPDGSRITFTSDRDGNHNIYAMNTDGNEQELINADKSNESYANWSLDGTRIAFVSDRDGNQEIYVSSVGTSGYIRLTNHLADDFNPVWSPDGRHVAFTSNRSGYEEIYFVTSDGKHFTKVARGRSPTWNSN